MPSSRQSITLGDCARLVEATVAGGSSNGSVGLELEWFVVGGDFGEEERHERARAAATSAALSAGGRVSFEPGGQVELSSLPFVGPSSACEASATDLQRLTSALAREGLGVLALGMHPSGGRPRVVASPRYDAMEAYFDAEGPAGRRMMRDTAALQINVDGGGDARGDDRWRRAHRLGPALAASFANSPFRDGAPSGWRSTRLATWFDVDQSRTASALGRDGAASDWLSYALAARVLLIRASADRFVAVPGALTFRDWVLRGHELGFPTEDDLAYHLTTLFPPVRPRGWLEVRYVDALPDPWWRVATAVLAALLHDDDAGESAEAAARGSGAMWLEAARYGLSHPVLADAARACFDAALEALPALGVHRGTMGAVMEYVERYVQSGRCPADERLERWARTGALSPSLEELLEVAWT